MEERIEDLSVGFEPGLIREKILRWYREGVAAGHRYLLVCQDGFDVGDRDMGLYHEFCDSIEEAESFSRKQFTGIDRLMEVLDLEQDLDEQLSRPPIRTLEELKQRPAMVH